MIAREKRLERWHPVFAFVPHKTDAGRWLWLETAERRLDHRTPLLGSPVWRWREKP